MAQDNTVLILGGGIALYLFMKHQEQARYGSAQAPKGYPPGAVPSMPTSAGSGLQQIAVGAIKGFFQTIAQAPGNNTSTTVIPNNAPHNPAQIPVQDAALPDGYWEEWW